MRTRHRDGGQASVELLGLLPVFVAIAFAGWHVALLGHAWWLTRIAADRAARAQAIGADVRVAAKRALPEYLRPGVVVSASEDRVRVKVRLKPVLGVRLGDVSASARFEEQR